ncbi:membrane protein insertase YidC [Thermomonospora umbrina]|uniref:Membrane protein insertase YidC n=1 Tax=Thermomonospora umbrina TaxID=111806 RepID=A0A3D9STD9_9ACTN|nr:membrane protein insertase YidC [Thermomonospora umbrina]REE97273.1 YidC/Oxa1 family membrane protein insertase [Thermomonospora umbrina]
MLDWLYELVAQLIIWIHSGLSTVVDPDSGWAWAGSIFLLTVFLRLLMVPLFVKQIHASRKMQELNPKVQALRKKYKNDKQRLNQEVMKLYQENGANPLSGCLPLLVQMPVFIGLFQVLNGIAKAKEGQSKFGMSSDLIHSAQHADILGAKIPDTFLNAWGENPKVWTAILVTGIAVLVSSTTTFFTVRSSMKRQPVMDENNPMAAAQKMMVVLAPVFGLFGLGFPLGVLLYWVTSNTWTLAQQHYIYSKYPPVNAAAGADAKGAPGKGTPSKGGPPAKGKGATKIASSASGGAKAKAKPKKDPADDDVDTPESESTPKAVRQQPTRKPRSKRSGSPKR